MNTELSCFAKRVRELITSPTAEFDPCQFSDLAVELFSLQFQANLAYRKICEGRSLTPAAVKKFAQIPFVPTAAFKELELTSLAPTERTTVFYSSGTTEQVPSRHFHNQESRALYETSLWSWFSQNLFSASGLEMVNYELILLAPAPALAPHSSLVHMFEIIRQKLSASSAAFVGRIGTDGSWTLDLTTTLAALENQTKPAGHKPRLILGTAFSFVHLLDFMTSNNLRIRLPAGSRVMETGGYKNRSRTMPKADLHTLITDRLGIAGENIQCEYGMSELSSQAYDRGSGITTRQFRFAPWAWVQIISPENGEEVAADETGLIRVFDLANVFSVAAIQTEDLGIRRGEGFELVGRAHLAEARGCSLLAEPTPKHYANKP